LAFKLSEPFLKVNRKANDILRLSVLWGERQRGHPPTNRLIGGRVFAALPPDVLDRLARLFSTHPPTEARIARLEAMARQGVGRGI
jgi:Zn-dependent protease with chaperone function